MLNRRILRIKAFKVLYSYAENPSMTLKEAENLLDKSCEATRDLYLFLLSISGPLTEEARSRIEAARSKFNPSLEESNPNLKFVENSLSPLLDEDPDFSKIIKKRKFSWEQYDVLLRHLYESIREKDYFRRYMENPGRSLQEDALLFRDIFASEFEDNAELEEILEDMSILWNDDLCYALNMCCSTLEELSKGKRWSLPDLFFNERRSSGGDDGDRESDRGFVYGLLRCAYRNFDKFYQDIAAATPKWDKNRICATDLALIECGLAESAAFPDMPKRIIINEYVEISKFYSTPESRAFVNGVLDRLINKQ